MRNSKLAWQILKMLAEHFKTILLMQINMIHTN
jgi:hypothetical protein